MKNIIAVILILIAFFTASCAENPVKANSANIANPNIGFADLNPSNYTILGRVTGTGQVTLSNHSSLFTGDTCNYGYLGEIGEAGKIETIYSGIYGIEPIVYAPATVIGRAKANAVYALIEAAEKKDADCVIFVTTKINNYDDDSGNTTSKVEVSGIAVKLK